MYTFKDIYKDIYIYEIYMNAVTEIIDKVSALKGKPAAYYADKAYVMRCNSKNKAFAGK